jgi:DNA repair protein RadB|tara:strand:- start:151 stop:852 length:702 start_codon:yes stop_codon:yes gene_type:complete
MKVATGSKVLDKMLVGGYETDVVNTIYGPAGSGKTVLAMLCCLGVARSGKKVIYIDTENSFSVERLKQIAPDYEKILSNMVFLKPVNFKEQKKAFEKLKNLVNDKIGLIVVDTIAMLYRIELGQKASEFYEINSSLGKQISYLSEIARKKNIPILITNQVYADFEKKGQVKLVGGDILKYGSKCLIELQITPQNNRRAILKKHRSIAQEKSIYFKIVEGGVIGTKEEKGFKLF